MRALFGEDNKLYIVENATKMYLARLRAIRYQIAYERLEHRIQEIYTGPYDKNDGNTGVYPILMVDGNYVADGDELMEICEETVPAVSASSCNLPCQEDMRSRQKEAEPARRILNMVAILEPETYKWLDKAYDYFGEKHSIVTSDPTFTAPNVGWMKKMRNAVENAAHSIVSSSPPNTADFEIPFLLADMAPLLWVVKRIPAVPIVPAKVRFLYISRADSLQRLAPDTLDVHNSIYLTDILAVNVLSRARVNIIGKDEYDETYEFFDPVELRMFVYRIGKFLT